tara:strand:+ start:869 stop:1363 length:495 start_codon:yes stop_codon:yes gene_type:complete
MVIWIIGISGVGKTFYAKKLLGKVNLKKKIHIDGDEIRSFFFKKLGYSKNDRRISGNLTVKLCSFLESKGYIVVCSMQSMFPDMQKKNRLIFKNYLQIHLQAKLSDLKKRNNKNIYNNKKNVLGVNLKLPKPYKSDFVFQNDFSNKYKKDLKKILLKIKRLIHH